MISVVESIDTNQRRILHEFQRFVLSRTSTNVRDDLYKDMIINTIYAHSSTDGILSHIDLKNHLQEDYSLKNLPELHICNAIECLVGEGNIILINEKLSLSQLIKNKLKKDIKESKEEQEKILSNIKNILQEKIPLIKSHQISLIANNLHLILAESFANNGTTTAKILTQSPDGMSELRSLSGFEENYCKKILNVISKEHHNKLDEILHDLFSNPSEEFGKYLFSMAQGYVYLGVLNIDPQFQKIQKLSWSKKKIYLDTNALLHLLFPSSTIHETIHTLVKLTQELGANIMITKETAIEYEQFLEYSKKKYDSIRYRPKYTSAYGDTHSENPFLLTYIAALKKDPRLTLNIFSKAFEEYDKLIESQYNMSIEDTDKAIDFDSEEMSRLKVHLTTNSPSKSNKVVTHDAYNILLVRKLRESGSDETGPVAWLLTTDNSLGRSERDTFGKELPYASITPDIWLQIISPFVSPTLTIKERSIAFSKLLSSRFKSHKMDLEDFNVFLTMFMDDSKFDVEHIRIIMGNDFVKEKTHQLAKEISQGKEITFEQFEPIMRKGLAAVVDDYNQKFADSTQEHTSKMNIVHHKIDELEEEIETLKEDKTTAEKFADELKFDKKIVKDEIIKTKSSFKYIVITLIVSAFVDVIVFSFLNTIPDFPVYYIPLILIGMMGLQTKIIFEIPKHV